MLTNLSASERADAMIARWEAEVASPLATAELDAELRAIVASCEAKYGIPSSEIHAAIDDGRLVESNEVCDWIMAHELLEDAV